MAPNNTFVEVCRWWCFPPHHLRVILWKWIWNQYESVAVFSGTYLSTDFIADVQLYVIVKVFIFLPSFLLGYAFTTSSVLGKESVCVCQY